MIPNNNQQSTVLELVYWKMRGGAQVIRNILEFLNIPYNNIFIESPKTFDLKYIYTTLHSLPILKDAGFQISHVLPIAKYVCKRGKRVDLIGKNIIDNAKIEEMIIRQLQFRNSLMIEILPSDLLIEDKSEKRIAFIRQSFKEPMRKCLLQQLNKTLQKHNWVLGYLTIIDFFTYDLCFSLSGYFPELIEQFTNLCVSFKSRFQEIPEIKSYILSNRVLNNMTLSNFSIKWKGDPKYA